MSGLDIFLSINNRQQVIQLPVIPTEFKIARNMSNSDYESISQGQLKLIGLPGLRGISLNSFFPGKEYPFSRSSAYMGWEYVRMLETWQDRRLPIRLVITETHINMPCVIDSFEYGLQDGSGDIYYTLGLPEFRFVKV
ncbi:MAG: hypothetical protein GXY34_12310 [Syntrophomonadaceae bacterium]|nr:hypothetical protein [Syntrophomonadaceae bacterium]